MRALVTGCAGFIGSNLTESLLDDGAEIVGVDCFNDNYARPQKLRNLEVAMDHQHFQFVPVDLARGEMEDLVSDVDVVFHLAAEPGVRASWGRRFETYVRNNVLATQELLEAAKRWPEKRFVFASSSSIYGQAEQFPTKESARPQPFSPYGVTKLSAEHLCQLYHGNYGVDFVGLRYFSVYGPRQRPDMAFNIFCKAALGKDSVVVFGDGQQTRDFTFVGDVVQGTRDAADAADVGGLVLNIGGGAQVTVKEVLEHLEALSGRELDVHYQPAKVGEVRDTCADSTLARRHLGFAPQTDWREGLLKEWEWIVDQHQERASTAR